MKLLKKDLLNKGTIYLSVWNKEGNLSFNGYVSNEKVLEKSILSCCVIGVNKLQVSSSRNIMADSDVTEKVKISVRIY